MPKKISSTLRARLQRIRLFLCDVDGVLTDGSIFIGGEREFKRFNIRDGLGLVLARRAGLKVGWVSARPSVATKMRAEELKIDFLVQQGDATGKTAAIEELLAREKFSWAETCFVGDDIIDLGPLTRAGLAVAVGDGVAEARAAAHYVTGAAGGRGAVREAVELILQAQGKWPAFVAKYSE
jgi:3-deoxy-D-manno-octulosonate 8-phosphate phosphatase (KDO 8-P phosphatase)